MASLRTPRGPQAMGLVARREPVVTGGARSDLTAATAVTSMCQTGVSRGQPHTEVGVNSRTGRGLVPAIKRTRSRRCR